MYFPTFWVMHQAYISSDGAKAFAEDVYGPMDLAKAGATLALFFGSIAVAASAGLALQSATAAAQAGQAATTAPNAVAPISDPGLGNYKPVFVGAAGPVL